MHTPVLINEIIDYLSPQPNENFIDATYGFGGHTEAILGKTAPNGKILGIEWDKETFDKGVGERSERLILVNDSYVNLQKIVEENNFENITGVLFDLGLSSFQLEATNRGFTFQKDQGLDMRFNQSNPLTAEKIINQWSRGTLEKIFSEYGEERFSGRIARNITEQREKQKIETTFQLVEIIRWSIPIKFQHSKIHFATKIFQALRIAVNDELGNIQRTLPQALEIIRPGGKIAVVSFHSLEDRIIKNFFREQSKLGKLNILTKKPISPSEKETTENKRARSAKLRVAEKL